MDTVSYNGYTVVADPHQLVDDGRWTTEVVLERDEGNSTTVTQFNAANSWETRDLAVEHCFDFGRQIIDGKIMGCVAP